MAETSLNYISESRRHLPIQKVIQISPRRVASILTQISSLRPRFSSRQRQQNRRRHLNPRTLTPSPLSKKRQLRHRLIRTTVCRLTKHTTITAARPYTISHLRTLIRSTESHRRHLRFMRRVHRLRRRLQLSIAEVQRTFQAAIRSKKTDVSTPSTSTESGA